MSTPFVTGLVKCRCQHCDGHIEFKRDDAGQVTQCPHCNLETTLFVPGRGEIRPASRVAIAEASGYEYQDHRLPTPKVRRSAVAPTLFLVIGVLMLFSGNLVLFCFGLVLIALSVMLSYLRTIANKQ